MDSQQISYTFKMCAFYHMYAAQVYKEALIDGLRLNDYISLELVRIVNRKDQYFVYADIVTKTFMKESSCVVMLNDVVTKSLLDRIVRQGDIIDILKAKQGA